MSKHSIYLDDESCGKTARWAKLFESSPAANLPASRAMVEKQHYPSQLEFKCQICGAAGPKYSNSHPC